MQIYVFHGKCCIITVQGVVIYGRIETQNMIRSETVIQEKADYTDFQLYRKFSMNRVTCR